MADGIEIGRRRVSEAPYRYVLDTSTLGNGEHVLQVWAHDMGKESVLSGAITVNVLNGMEAASGAILAPAPTRAPTNAAQGVLTYPVSGQGIAGIQRGVLTNNDE